ncbi:hydantoinase B/oxoprolinase family protein [Bordetella tumulicola]|uniref:hydantoinase B/oxoprolinase family protein n=1 Tax=Bordetella tumulicola TaxID=1649133 RepID=UPI0039F03711
MTILTPALRDPIEMEVFVNRLLSITEDMNNTLVRSSFSTNIKERKDCSVALFDATGRLVAQGTQIPLHLGSLNGAMQAVLDQYPAAQIEPGDAFISNDPYLAGGSHLPDINIVTPVFHEDKLAFFTANVGHHADVGGSVPGSIAGSLRSVFEEGIRIPVVRIAQRGEIQEDLLRLICSNTRDPEERWLDLKVQVATNERGTVAVQGLLAQMGLERALTAVEDLIQYTRARLERRISELNPGTYSFMHMMDDDGMGGGEPVPLQVAVTVLDARLRFDFSGSGAQARGAMNLPESALKACVYYAVKALLDPELAANSGLFAPLEIVAPPGSIVSPVAPAAVGARSLTAQKVAGAIFGAFRQALPQARIMASGNDVCPAIVFSGRLPNRPGDFVYLETVAGGSGARDDMDGMDGVHVHMTNSSNLPVEALENEYPLRVERYALIPDSGGVGRQRGGMAVVREVRALADGIIFSARSDNHVAGRATGVLGGGDGRQAKLVYKRADGSEEILSSKTSSLRLSYGESVCLETSGAGGFGEPQARALTALADDLRDERVSPTVARQAYGDLVERALASKA